MPTIEESIEIERPDDEVFAFATDPDLVTQWQGNMVSYEQETGGSREAGVKDRGSVRVAGKRFGFTDEVLAWEPPHRTLLRSIESPMAWEMEMRFERLDADRTRMTIHQEVGDLGRLFGRLGDAIVTRMYSRDVRSNLRTLKELLENA
jgi:uncharacterized protein YndB with AHSA1/START domain